MTVPAAPDFESLFRALPALYLILRPDPPDFTIVAANDAYVRGTLTTAEAIRGRPLFEVFPDANPANLDPSGVSNLQASLLRVLRTREHHRMAMQRYDIQRGDGSWEERHWSPVNTPVLAPDGAVRWIVHEVADVTALARTRAEAQTARQLARDAERAPDEERRAHGALRAHAAQLRADSDALRANSNALRADLRTLLDRLGERRPPDAPVD